MKAKGTFEVELRPLTGYATGSDGVTLGRYSLDKQFSGDLDGKSQGEMLSASTAVAGSAGYVALEQVTGELAGRAGSFVLQHFGVMAGGADRLMLEVVPDSGSNELVGLAGTMTLIVDEGVHRYDFDYTLPG